MTTSRRNWLVVANAARARVLEEADAERVLECVTVDLPMRGVRVMGVTRSPIVGGETKGNRRGNVEWLVLLAREA